MDFEQNVRQYPWYRFFRECNFWGPAFILYFTSILTLEQTLWLESVYYVAVAALEVPSGYVSDRFGRKYTLVASSACLATAFFLFFTGSSFAVFCLAQLFLACGYAAASGTDTALLFESLKEAGREKDHARQEARALNFAFRAGAVGAIGGGLLAMGQLRWIYAASCVAALVSMAIALGFREPPGECAPPQAAFGSQMTALARKSVSGPFRFFTLYTLGMTLLIHFPYEFYQPYLDRVMDGLGQDLEITPLVTGLHLATTAMVGSYCTRFSAAATHGCQIRRVLVGTTLFQVLLLSAMAAVVHPIVVVLLAGRTMARALATPLVNAQLSPRLHRGERSTYLSLQSLMGRLGYGMALLVLPFGSRLFGDPLQGSLFWSAVIGLGLLVLLSRTPSPADIPCCSGHGHGHGAP